MNTIIQSLKDRKSVRAYEERSIEPEKKDAIIDAALQAPSAGNMTLYTIIDVTDQHIKDCLAESCDHQPFIAKAPMVLIFCADYKRWYDVFLTAVDGVRKPDVGDMFLAQADAIIAAQNAVTAAESLGIGSCYIGDITEQFEYHKELLNLPEYVVPACMLCFGYPTKQQTEREKPPRFKASDIVHENGYDMKKAADMAEMLKIRGDMGDDEFSLWLQKFCKRKWNSDFSVEMSRSCAAMIDAWKKGE